MNHFQFQITKGILQPAHIGQNNVMQAFEIIFLCLYRDTGLGSIGEHTIALCRIQILQVDDQQRDMVLLQGLADFRCFQQRTAISLPQGIDMEKVLIQILQVSLAQILNAMLIIATHLHSPAKRNSVFNKTLAPFSISRKSVHSATE